MLEKTNDKFISDLENEKGEMLMYHIKSVKALIEVKGKSIYSNILDQDGNPTVSPASLTDEKRLNDRYDYFMICLDALELEEIQQEKVSLKKSDKLKKDFERLKRVILLLLFHKETLIALINKKELKISLDLNESLANEEGIKERIEYYHLRNEAINLQREIDAKKELINSHEEHLSRTIKEVKIITVDEMDELIATVEALRLKGKDKSKATAYISNFKAGKVTGLESRYDFYKGMKHFIDQRV